MEEKKKATLMISWEAWEKAEELKKETGLPISYHVSEAIKEYYRKYMKFKKKLEEKDRSLGIIWREKREKKKW